jgi:benzoyl-CoA reductase/2-hydroxyglutaryl-CoA dehydratase subunit BcrC/BadD/HgdB
MAQNPETIPLESARLLGRIMRSYYTRLDEAVRSKTGKVAWCSSIGPCELLVALGFEVFFPENHGAMLGASRTAVEFIPLATVQGYSSLICSYLTSDIGASLAGFTPLTKAHGLAEVPRPDVLVYNTNQCREVQDWFAYHARSYGVPLLGIHSPRCLPEVRPSHVQDVRNQLEELIPALERIAGRRFEPDRLREAVYLSRECTLRYEKVLRTAAQCPAPITFFDLCIHMAPAVVLK